MSIKARIDKAGKRLSNRDNPGHSCHVVRETATGYELEGKNYSPEEWKEYQEKHEAHAGKCLFIILERTLDYEEYQRRQNVS